MLGVILVAGQLFLRSRQRLDLLRPEAGEYRAFGGTAHPPRLQAEGQGCKGPPCHLRSVSESRWASSSSCCLRYANTRGWDPDGSNMQTPRATLLFPTSPTSLSTCSFRDTKDTPNRSSCPWPRHQISGKGVCREVRAAFITFQNVTSNRPLPNSAQGPREHFSD